MQQRHHASITDPKAIGNLLRAIHSYEGFFATKCALRLAPLFFVRPGELRKAEWDEFNFETAEWRIPASKMKMRELHIVPLSTQAIAILRELHMLLVMANSSFLVFAPQNDPCQKILLHALFDALVIPLMK